MGYNRSGVKFVARLKRRRREEMRLTEKAGEAKAKVASSSPAKKSNKPG